VHRHEVRPVATRRGAALERRARGRRHVQPRTLQSLSLRAESLGRRVHDIGLPSSDRGRALGAPALLDDPLNAAGEYSDDRDAGAAKLLAVSSETASEGSFRTASLRGVGQRTFFGHAAHEQTLRGFILDVYRRGGRGGGRRGATTGVRDAKLDDVNVDGDDVNDLIAFLHTLDCPAPSPELLAH
jgi:cytochrome c peroxidase